MGNRARRGNKAGRTRSALVIREKRVARAQIRARRDKRDVERAMREMAR